MLWKAFKSGDEKALITIFDRFSQPLYNYGCKIAGEGEMVKDAIQDLFMELWQKRERLGDTDAIKFYLLKSLRRKLRKLQKKSTGRLLSHIFLREEEDAAPSREFVIISEQVSAEKKEKIMNVLKKLTPRQHEAIFLRYFEELSCDQIASLMGLSKQGVYNLIHHALNELRKNKALESFL